MKYKIGNSLRINIKGYTEEIAANVDEDGNIDPINLYIIDSGEDGRSRYISEEVLDAIVAMGANVYTETPVSGRFQIKEVGEGQTVRIAGIDFEVLDRNFPSTDGRLGVLVLAKDITEQMAFDEDNCNDWRESSLRKYLNEDFKEHIEDAIGKDKLIPFQRDLLSDDGMKDYGECEDYISLITCEEYREYREHISDKSDWWWTLTPWSCRSGDSYRVRYVYTDGSLGLSSACAGSYGVAPAFLLLPSLEVEVNTTKEENADV